MRKSLRHSLLLNNITYLSSLAQLHTLCQIDAPGTIFPSCNLITRST